MNIIKVYRRWTSQEALKITEQNLHEAAAWVKGKVVGKEIHYGNSTEWHYTAKPGEWIVKDGTPAFTYSDEQFRANYQRIKSSPARKEKGSSWEREACAELSLWLTEGETAKGLERIQRGRGLEGDIKSVHPKTYEFCQQFLVECKHYTDLDIPALLLKSGNFNTLRDFIVKAEKEAIALGKEWMIFAKQDRYPPFVLVSGKIFSYTKAWLHMGDMTYHILKNEGFLLSPASVIMLKWDDLKKVNPEVFLKKVVGKDE